MSRSSASPSLAARFSALLSRDSTPDASPAKRSSAAAAAREQDPARSPPKSPEHGAAASASSSPAASVSSPAPSPSASVSGGFFSALKAKASGALAAHRSENAAKDLAKKAGLHRLNRRMLLLQFSSSADASSSSSASASASSVSAEADQFKHLDAFLNAYHPGTHLVLDIGGILAARGCPDDLFPAARLALEFNVPAGSDSIGTIDAAARVAQAVARWYSADGDGSDSNVVVLACDPLRCLQLLAAVVLYCTEDFDDILSGAMHSVLLLDSNRFSAQMAMRSLPVSSRRFLSDFALLRSYDPGFTCAPPKVWIHSLVIHCLPQVEEEGTRLLVVLIANRREFVYTSQQQGGGHLWIPTTDSSPLTVSVPIAAAFQGEATLKVWHLPEQSSTRNPRVLIVETKLHSAVLDLPCWRTKGKEEDRIDGCIPAISAPAAASSSSDSSASGSDAPLPYIVHRMLLRKDDLELGTSVEASAGPSFLSLDHGALPPPEIEYHKRFGITVVATPMEESRYVTAAMKGSTPAKDSAAGRERSASAAAAGSNSINRSRATSPQPIPTPAAAAVLPIAHPVSQLSSSSSPVLSPGTPETDLLALSAAYNLPPAAATTAAAAAPEDEFALEFNPTPLPSAMSPSTPPRKASAAAAATPSSARSSPVPAAAFSSSSSSSSAVAAPAVSSWVAPVIPVPASARSTAGLRFWHEDKQGRERNETASEQAERTRLAAERVALDNAYGRGQWRREGGILYAQAPSGPRNPGMFDPANLSLEMILRSQGALAQEQARARALHAVGLAAAPPASYASQQEAEAAMHAQLISQHQQQQQQQHDAHQRQRAADAAAAAAAAAQPQGPSAEQIYSDPNSSAEEKDAAYARILQAQFNEEDEMQQRMAQLQHHPRSSGSSRSSRHRSHRSSRPAAAALAAGAPGEVAPPNSASGVDGAGQAEMHGPRMVRAGSEPMGAAGSAGGASSSAPAAGSPLDATLQSAASIPSAASVGAAASPSPSSASASASTSAGEILPPEFVQLASDMELARQLQSQFDTEASSRSVAALSQAQHGLDPDRLHYEQLLSLSAVIGPAPHARRGGASGDEIAALPEFAVTLESKYLEEECQVCRESFVAGETLRQLQCIHAYHKDCIDPWLRQNRTCPVCKVPVHHAR